jgi:transposase
MAPINDAIEEIELHGSGSGWSYRKIAKKYGVARESLRRLHQGINAPMEEQKFQRQKLYSQQEAELMSYIEGLTACCLQPTREMVQNFASAIAKQDVGQSWVTRFLSRNSLDLEAHWTTGMDRDRHRADSEDKYQLFFQLLLEKIEEYNIQPEHSYNMDEKGFLIGVRYKGMLDSLMN